MGFRIAIDEDASRILELVQADPSTVFGKLYSAYLLFLVGAHDQSQLKWLVDNTKILDALTGSSIAFGVFAQEFIIKLRTHRSYDERAPRNVGTVDVKTLQQLGIERLVTSGQVGRVIDEDEITARTYGTDDVARQLGLLGELPCVVVIDAVPLSELYVIRLTDDVTKAFIPLMRDALAEFGRRDGDRIIRDDARRLIKIQNEIERVKGLEAHYRTEMERCDHTVNKIRSRIDSGRATADLEYLERIINSRINDKRLLEKKFQELPQYQQARLDELENELQNAIFAHRQHKDLMFSSILKKEARHRGIRSTLNTAKGSILSYASSLLKPQTLIDLWAAA